VQLDAAARPWPVWCFRDSYLVLGGPTPVSSSYQPPTDGGTPRPHEGEPPREAHLYLYKIDAIARMMLPEEMASTASKSLLDRMLADLDPPKMQKKQVRTCSCCFELTASALSLCMLSCHSKHDAKTFPCTPLRQTYQLLTYAVGS
jgi:hypothetical protein